MSEWKLVDVEGIGSGYACLTLDGVRGGGGGGGSDVHIISGVEFCSARPIDTRGDTFSRCCRFILRSNRFRCSEGGDSHRSRHG